MTTALLRIPMVFFLYLPLLCQSNEPVTSCANSTTTRFSRHSFFFLFILSRADGNCGLFSFQYMYRRKL